MRRVVCFIIGIVVFCSVGIPIEIAILKRFYPEPCTYFTPGLSCEEEIWAHIEGAKTIDIAVYSITNDFLVDTLQDAHKRGAKIRIITDYLQSQGRNSLIPKLRNMGIPVRTNKSEKTNKLIHKIMHNKFAIFNNKYVATGSYNWTNSATQRNAENCIFLENAERKYRREFEHLWDLYKD